MRRWSSEIEKPEWIGMTLGSAKCILIDRRNCYNIRVEFSAF